MSTPYDLLFVCTGNICRSPTAELLAAHRLPRDRFRVHSAGTRGLDGWPIQPDAARPLAELGIGYDAFRARRLTAAMVREADLVLTAAVEHSDAVITLVPNDYTYTLRQYARVLGADLDGDDIADPYGLGPEAYDRAIADITAALDPVLAHLGALE